MFAVRGAPQKTGSRNFPSSIILRTSCGAKGTIHKIIGGHNQTALNSESTVSTMQVIAPMMPQYSILMKMKSWLGAGRITSSPVSGSTSLLPVPEFNHLPTTQQRSPPTPIPRYFGHAVAVEPVAQDMIHNQLSQDERCDIEDQHKVSVPVPYNKHDLIISLKIPLYPPLAKGRGAGARPGPAHCLFPSQAPASERGPNESTGRDPGPYRNRQSDPPFPPAEPLLRGQAPTLPPVPNQTAHSQPMLVCGYARVSQALSFAATNKSFRKGGFRRKTLLQKGFPPDDLLLQPFFLNKFAPAPVLVAFILCS